MQHNVLDLPLEDVFYYLAMHHLGPVNIQAWRCVAKVNQNFFADPELWIQKIASNFNFDENELRSLAFSRDLTTLQLGYKRYSSFLKLANKMDLFKTAANAKALQFFVKDKTTQLLIFICCTDHVPSFIQAINLKQNLGFYCELTLRLGSIHIPQLFYTKVFEQMNASDLLKKDMLRLTVISGRLDMVRYLFESKYKLEIPRELFLCAVQSGDIAMLDYVSSQYKFTELDFFDFFHRLYTAATYGHLDMCKHLLEKSAKIYEIILNLAASSGSIELVKYLVKEHHQSPTQTTFLNAIKSGNNDLCAYLTNNFANINPDKIYPEIYAASNGPELQFSKLAPIVENASIEWRQNHLDEMIAASGHLELLKIALAPISLPDGTKAQVFPRQETLYFAALSGNLEMVQFLLDFPGNIQLKPNNRILSAAIDSQNMALVQFLLHPANRFYTEDNLPVLIDAVEGLLVNSHQSFLHALRLANDLSAIKKLSDKKIQINNIAHFFNISFESHSEHCIQMLQDVLLNPSSYNLNIDAVKNVELFFKTFLDAKREGYDDKGFVPFGRRVILNGIQWLKSHEQEIANAIAKLEDSNRSHLKPRVR